MRRFSSVPVTLMWLTGFVAGQVPGTRLPGPGKSGLLASDYEHGGHSSCCRGHRNRSDYKLTVSGNEE
jgi:hypothetical protein